MGRTQFKVDPGDDARVETSTGPTTEPAFTAPPDELAPAMESLDDLMAADATEPLKRWLASSRRWVYLKPMDAGSKRDWLAEVVITKADGEPDIARDHMENAIARCLCNAHGELIANTAESKGRLTRLRPQTFDELWEHVAVLNVLRKQDGEALKNSYAGDTGTATSPNSPASTEPRPCLVT